jgi:hypothetical protein
MFAPFQVSGQIKPAATASTFGASFVIAPDSGYQKLQLGGLGINVTTIGTETLTFSIAATRNDGSTVTLSPAITATATGEKDLTVTQLAQLMKDIGWIVSLSVAVESSIASSTAAATVTAIGSEFPQYGDRNY